MNVKSKNLLQQLLDENHILYVKLSTMSHIAQYCTIQQKILKITKL